MPPVIMARREESAEAILERELREKPYEILLFWNSPIDNIISLSQSEILYFMQEVG